MWAQSDAGKESMAKSLAKWKQSDEGKKNLAKSQAKSQERKDVERQELIAQQAARLCFLAWLTTRTAPCCAHKRSQRHACGRP